MVLIAVVLLGLVLASLAVAAETPSPLPIKLPMGLQAYLDPSGVFLSEPAPKDGAALQVGATLYATVAQGDVRVSLHQMDAMPFIEQGRTFVPVRYMAKAIGVEDIGWDEETRTVTLSTADIQMHLTIDVPVIQIGDETITMDVVPVIRHGRTYLPARFVADAFGWEAIWEPSDRAVFLVRQ